MSMRKRLWEISPAKRIKDMEMRIRFAKVCLVLPTSVRNEEVYNALSHLAKIPELKIELCMYEHLRIPPENNRLDVDAFLEARNKLAEAMLLHEDTVKEEYAIS